MRIFTSKSYGKKFHEQMIDKILVVNIDRVRLNGIIPCQMQLTIARVQFNLVFCVYVIRANGINIFKRQSFFF